MNDEHEYDDESLKFDAAGDTILCPRCHYRIYEDAVRCPHCGEYVCDDEVDSGRRRWWKWTVSIMALLALLGFILSYVLAR